MDANAKWIEPANIAADLRTQADRIRHLGETRPGMPEAGSWEAMLRTIADGLAAYADSCRQSAAAPAAAPAETLGFSADPRDDGPFPPPLVGRQANEHPFRGGLL